MQCSKCGSDMVLRERKSDGNKFWGCSSFPKCNGITKYVKGSEKATSVGFKPIVEKKVDLPTPDSRFQQPILTAFLNEHKNLMVKACAGSGKTTLLKMLSYQLPKHKSIVYVVYNAKIRDEAVKVLPDWVSPMTSHQLGFAAIRNYNGKAKTELDDQKVQNIFKKMIQDSWDEEKWMIAPVCNLVSKLKNTLAPSDNNTLMKVAERFNIDLNDSAFRIFDYVREVLRQNNQTTAVIDFDDMLYLVWKLKMPVQKFDIILTDECFPYKIPVLMENGVNLPIGKIVDEKMTGKVLTFNTETGKQEYKEIIGWHKIPNSKQLVKVLGVQFPDCNGGQRAAVTCTFNHKIWTKEDGWLEAEKLVPGYHHIQGETSAKTSQAYKITSKGRKVLSETITKNNELKKTGNYEGKYFGGGFEEKNRGGNGKGLTVPQRIYLDRLGEGWFSEYLVTPTKKQVSECRAASRYKIDIANPELKIAIELDGSLKKAEAIYEKKDKVLTELGWQVYHFENNYAVQNLETIVKDIYEKDCPVWCQVTSVEKTQVKEFYVYDITVEDNHNFYANGVLVHNCQDFNQAQLHLIKAASHGETQIIGVGDSDQSMYGFRGADLEAMSRMEKFIEATTMPLSITYRVPKSGVRLVNELFPEIAFEAALWAEEGVVRTAGSQSFLQELVESDMVLCRTNAPLVKPVLTLLRQGIKACIAGRDIGNNLANLLVRFNKKGLSLTEVLAKICDYRDNECGKLIQLGKEMAASNLVDTVDTVIALSDGMRTVDDTIARIKSIFTDNNEGITFSTVHRAKGLEAPRVFILEPQLLPHPMAKADWEQVQEKNIAYVAITRHKKELIFVGQGLGSFYQGSSEAVQFKEEEVKEEEEVEVKTESFGEEKQVSDTFVEVFGSNKVKSVPVCPF